MSFLAGDDIEIPDDFPKAMMIYGEAKRMPFMNSERGAAATFSGEDERAKIASSVKKELEGDGGKIQTSVAHGKYEHNIMYQGRADPFDYGDLKRKGSAQLAKR